MRERTPFPATLVSRLEKLRMFGLTGARAASIDTEAMMSRGFSYEGAVRALVYRADEEK